jgi:GH43 family beta-xylosidase
MRSVSLVALLLGFLASPVLSVNPLPSLLDPLFSDVADPCVLEHNGRLYVYPTASQEDFSVWSAPLPTPSERVAPPDREEASLGSSLGSSLRKSPAASTWSPADLSFSKFPTPVLTNSVANSHSLTGECLLTKLIPALGKGSLVWAPHVHYDVDSQTFYMYYSACLNLYVASSASPTGPFADPVFLQYLAIDPFVQRDAATGRLMLYYADINLPRIWLGEESIYGVELSSPTEMAKGESHIQLIKPDQHPWEFFRSSALAPRGINEGPWMIQVDDLYYLMYSGAGADTKHYGIGYATSESPLGPFVKFDANPITSHPGAEQRIEEEVYGPGHHSIWKDGSSGKLWVFYHQKSSPDSGWDRSLCVDELLVVDGVLKFEATRG